MHQVKTIDIFYAQTTTHIYVNFYQWPISSYPSTEECMMQTSGCTVITVISSNISFNIYLKIDFL